MRSGSRLLIVTLSAATLRDSDFANPVSPLRAEVESPISGKRGDLTIAEVILTIRPNLRARIPGIKIYMGTLTSAVNSTNGSYGTPANEEKRLAYNNFIRTSGIFDGVVDFDAVTRDPKTGELKAEYQPNSSTGGPGDKLHPNRAGYAAMGQAIDLAPLRK